MAVISARTTSRPAVAGARKSVVPRGLKKPLAAVTSATTALVASPALALVDDRLNGDGAGIPLGLNEPVLGWVMLGMFSLIWVLYATSAKGFGGQDEEDGLSL